MSIFRDDLPYSQKSLEKLATALRMNSALLWVNPATNAFSLKAADLRDKSSTSLLTTVVEGEDESDK